VFDLPVVLSTVETKSFSGNLWPQIQAVFLKQVLYKGMSREISPPGLGTDRFFSRHSARLIVHALTIWEWSSSGVLFVSSQEAARYFPPCGSISRL
jgi:hypothetical protein